MLQSLAGAWRLRPEFLDVGRERFAEVMNRPRGKFEFLGNREAPNYKPFPKREGFLQAQVPCDVVSALVDNGVIPEPLERDNTKGLQWLMDFSWWFAREVEVSPALFAHEQIRLFIEVLDYKADIILNGVPAFRHTNAFVAFDEDVKRYLHPGRNEIIIRLTCGVEDYPAAPDTMSFYSVNGTRNQRTYLRKPAYSFGWDWNRPLPTCGIGRDIHLEGLSGAKIAAFRADTLAIDGDSARLGLHFEIDNLAVTSADEVLLHYEIGFGGKVVAKGCRELYLPGGYNHYQEELILSDARLWWPNEYGPQNLYTVTASVTCRGAVNAMVPKQIGIRTVTIDHSKRADGTRNFRFVVNGVAIWCKGGNWVPTDSVYLRTTNAKYTLLVEEARAQHFTMLRIWGGGVYEPEHFYAECDRCGILLMHDFMYACAYAPDYRDDFLREAEREAQYQARRLAHHASMAVWSGNNEIHESYSDWFTPETDPAYYYGYKIFNHIQPKAVHDHSPLIPYMPSSPFFGTKANDPAAGDVHAWNIMGRLTNPDKKPFLEMLKMRRDFGVFDQLADMIRFSSEYGFHGPLMRSSVQRFHAGEPVSRQSVSWAHHEGEFFKKEDFLNPGITHDLIDADKLDEDGYLLYGGIMHGVNYRELMEALRRREHTSGGLIWMYNDCWPETGWTTVDYYGTRKIAFYFLKRAFAPRKLILRVFEGRGSIVALNELPEPVNVTLEYGYMSFTGERKETQTIGLTLGRHSFNELPAFPAPGDLIHGFYYVRAVEKPEGPEGLDPATSLRGNYRSFAFPDFRAEIVDSRRDGDDLLVTVQSETYVPFAYLACQDDRTRLDDNYFELLPGVPKTVRVERCRQVPELRLVKVERE